MSDLRSVFLIAYCAFVAILVWNRGTGKMADQTQTAAPMQMQDAGAQQVMGADVPTKDADAIKLFVGQIPRSYTEVELKPLFEPYGQIFDFMIIKDKMTGISRGCAFLTFCSRQSAMNAIANLHEKITLPSMSNPLKVKVADSDAQDNNRKLFVGMITKTMTENDLHAMFSPFGTVEDTVILRNFDQQSKGCGFVKFTNPADAQRAISSLNGTQTMEGCRAPLVVKFADTDKQKQQRMQQRQMQMGAGMYGYGQFGGMPGMGYGYQQYRAPQAFGTQDMAQAYAGVQQYNAQGLGQQPYAQQAAYGRAPSQTEGPDGSNLFIYHLPNEFNDASLGATFAPFGNVVSAKVFVDRMTGQSKCFGFVSYDNPGSAQAAIQSMNGFEIGGKRLKVQLKRPKY
eukprot:m.16313 g.16313  ORF g.16313 m.16313 type:complete len:398 (+) comp7035_c0_seq1:79-1272(+)